jgi:outer membrane protein assembly factor BamB
MGRYAVLPLLLLTIPAGAQAAENWPQFRGPTGQGHSSVADLPTRWSPTENVVWKAAIPGKGWSSPIVWNGRIYLTTAVPLGDGPSSDQSLRALCVDGESGEIVWNAEVFQQETEGTGPIHQKNSHASPTPVTNGEHLYVHFGTRGTACLTLDGETVWATRELKYEPQHGGGGSPVLVGDLLVVSCDGNDRQFIVALDRQTGEIRWKTERPDDGDSSRFSFTTPLVIEVDGRRQIVSPASDQVIAYEPEDGSEIWRVRYKGTR